MTEIADTNFLKIIDDLVVEWGRIVVPIFVNSKSPTGATGIGTGFIAGISGKTALITALHVITEILRSDVQVVNIGGKAVNLAGLCVLKNSEQDVAVIPLAPEWRQANGLPQIAGAELGSVHSDWQRTNVFVAIGYPASKNDLEQRYGRVDRYCHSISLSPIESARLDTDIPNPLLLRYNHKTVFNSDNVRQGPQVKLQGMSGGPCMEILQRMNPDGSIGYTLDAIAVLSEWHRDAQVIVASRLAEVFPDLFL